MSRKRLALGSVKRVAKNSAPGYRVGEDAVDRMRECVEEQIAALSATAVDLCKRSKRVTVDKELLDTALEETDGLCDLRVSQLSNNKTLPKAPLVAHFVGGSKLRTSKDAKDDLTNIASCYLVELTQKSAQIATTGRRQTIKARDVDVACGM
jgi:histone H3/H4